MKNLAANWNLMRLVRLVIGMYLLIQGFRDGFWLLVIVGGLLSLLAILNTGCCTTGSCVTPARKPAKEPEDIKFEEIL